MRILHIITGLGFGGAERLLLNTCKYQMLEGHEVQVIFLKNEGPMGEKYKDAGIKFEKFDIKGLKIVFSFLKLIIFIKKGGFDVVHTHLPHAAFIGRIAAIIAGSKNIVNTIHGTDRWYLNQRIYAKIAKTIDAYLNNLQYVKPIAISKAVKDFVERNEKFMKRDKIKVVYNAIDFIDIEEKLKEPVNLSDFKINEDGFLIVNLGRLGKEKGQLVLLKAINELINVKSIRDIKCFLIGDGERREELEQYILENDLKEKVFILGIQENPYKYLKKADLFVMPSLYEGFGIAVLEAYYCRVPVIASRIEGLMEVVQQNVTGITYEVGNHKLLSEEIMKFYNKTYDKESFISNGRKFIKELDITNYVNELNEVYSLEG